MQILHIITDLHVGGAERMLLRLLEASERTSTEPTVISLVAGGDLAAEFTDAGIPVFSPALQRGAPNAAALLRLARMIASLRPDIVQSWMYHADLLGGLATRLKTRVPVVWGLHNSDLDRFRTKRSTRLVARACAALSHVLPARIISCSQTAVAVHRRLGYQADKFVVIPNGFDTETFFPDASARPALRQDLGLGAEIELVGLVARFDPQKDHRNFISAAAQVAAIRPHTHFVLIGADCTRDNKTLSAWIDSTGAAQRFHLLGLRQDLPKLTAGLDLAVTASAYGEAFPLVIGEAMSCAVPCVVTNVGDSALILGDSGRTVPPRNPQALANAIDEVLSFDPANRLALGLAARERIVANYSLPAIASRYQELYDQILAARAHN